MYKILSVDNKENSSWGIEETNGVLSAYLKSLNCLIGFLRGNIRNIRRIQKGTKSGKAYQNQRKIMSRNFDPIIKPICCV